MSDFVWSPSPEFTATTNVARFMAKHGIPDARSLLQRSVDEYEWFWDAAVEDLGIEFAEPYHTVVDASRGNPWAEWYVGGRLNIVANCLERHAWSDHADRVCLISEREDGAVVQLTYRELFMQVERCAAALTSIGIGKGDRVAAYMPMTQDVVIQMLATFKLGAIFIPIFKGFQPEATAARLRDADAKVLFTADGSYWRGDTVPIKGNADAALTEVSGIEHVVVARYTDDDIVWDLDRDIAWPDFLNRGDAVPTRMMNAMDPALILYTSGTTGLPKGTVHSHAGALVQIAKETGYAFDLKSSDRLFWLTDMAWMMGPWSVIGALFHGATVVLYEGVFDYPAKDRLWEMLARHQVSVFGVSPTVLRIFMRRETDEVARHDLSGLRILGTTGEPCDETTWRWFFETVGKQRCPVINVSGGTDILGSFLSPLPIVPLKPCSLAAHGLGMAVDVWSEDGKPVRDEVGYLVATKPAPSMTRGLWNDPDRYVETYWSTWPDVWNHGDWASIDKDGCWFVHGRADDTIKVAGRRIGPAEIEGALMATGKVAEAAAVGVPHEVKGEGIVCFVVLHPDHTPSEELRQELMVSVVGRLGKVDQPEQVLFVPDLPKTSSANILRRLVRDTYLGRKIGDRTSVQNPEALKAISDAK